MSKPLPVWQELPLHFKRDVVGKLDLRSRFRLGMCSKTEQHLVDSTALCIQLLKLSITDPNHIDVNFESGGKLGQISCSRENTIDQFLQFFKGSKVTVKNMSFYNYSANEEIKINLILELAQKTQDPGFLLKADSFLAFGVNGQQYLTLLKCFDPNVLRQGDFMYSNCLSGDRDEIIATEQWKKLAIFGRTQRILCEVFRTEDFLHMNEFHLYWKDATRQEVWKVIQNFVDRDVPYQGAFSVEFAHAQEIGNILENPGPVIKREDWRVLQYFNETIKICSEYHIVKLPMPSTQNSLIVRFYLRRGSNQISKVKGVVCHVEDEDFEGSEPKSRGRLQRHLAGRFPDRVNALG